MTTLGSCPTHRKIYSEENKKPKEGNSSAHPKQTHQRNNSVGSSWEGGFGQPRPFCHGILDFIEAVRGKYIILCF